MQEDGMGEACCTTGEVTAVYEVSVKIPEWKTLLGHGHGYEGIAT